MQMVHSPVALMNSVRTNGAAEARASSSQAKRTWEGSIKRLIAALPSARSTACERRRSAAVRRRKQLALSARLNHVASRNMTLFFVEGRRARAVSPGLIHRQ